MTETPTTANRTTAASTRPLLKWAIALSVIAGLLHLLAFDEHRREWWAYATFFMLASIVQIFYGIVLGFQPWRSASVAGPPLRPNSKTRTFLQLGIWGNVFLVVLYVQSRTLGVPFGPEAGEPEPVTWLGIASKATELVLIALLVLMWRRTPRDPAAR